MVESLAVINLFWHVQNHFGLIFVAVVTIDLLQLYFGVSAFSGMARQVAVEGADLFGNIFLGFWIKLKLDAG